MTGTLLPATIWQRELCEFVGRRRALAIKLAFPALLAAPLVFSSAPPAYVALALTMLLAMISALGSGAVLSRERVGGLTARYRVLPVRPGALALERVAAMASIDLLQVVPVLVLVALRHPGQAAWWPGLVVATVAVLLTGNVLGAVASRLTTSPGEVMLMVLIPLLPALFLSGVFVPATDPWLSTVSRFLPFTYLHEALAGSLRSHPLLLAWEPLGGGVVFTVLAALAALVAGRAVFETD